MSGINFKMALCGVADLHRKLQLTDRATRDRTKAAIERGTKAVAALARGRAPKVTGEMAYTIRDEYSKEGLTGYVKVGIGKLQRRSRAGAELTAGRARRAQRLHEAATSRRQERALQFRLANSSKDALSVADLGAYAPIVEYGDPRRHHRKHPFLVPSLLTERPTIVRELATATQEGVHTGEAG